MKVRSLVAAALLAPATGLLAQQTPPVTKDAPAAAAGASSAALPSAQQIIDRYVAAIGGRAAIQRLQSYRATGTFEMPAQGMRGDLTIAAARPNRMAVTIDVPGVGQIVQGYDGTVAWSVNPMQGPRLAEGKELQQTQEDSDFESSFLRTATGAATRQVLGDTTIGGQRCYRVKTVRASGSETEDCFAAETGLLVASTVKRETPMGPMVSTTLVEDYKDFGGVKVATRARVQIPALGSEQVLTFTTFTVNAAEPSAFARPAAIEALVKQKTP